MACANECQGNLEAACEHLEFIEKTLKSMQITVTAEGKAMESKENEKDEHRINLEAKARTVEALRKAVRAVKKSVISDGAAKNDMDESLQALRETLKSEKKIVAHEEDTLESEKKAVHALRDGVETAEAPIDVQKIEVGKKDCMEAIEAENSVNNVTEIVKEKTTEYKKSTKDKTAKSVPKSVESMEGEEKFLETWNTMINQEIALNKTFGEIKEIMTEAKETHQEAEEHFEEENDNSQLIEQSPLEAHTDNISHMLAGVYTGMDNPLNAMLFSEQLIEYVLNKLGYTWPCIEGARNLPKGSAFIGFSKVIGEAMLAIIDSNIEKIAESYKQLMEKNVHEIDSFRTEVCVTATFYFAQGYSHYNFLTYAAQLAGLSAFYFASGNTQIAEASAQVLAYILNHFIFQFCFLSNSDWFSLHLEAQKLRREIEDREIEFILPTGSV